jgi:hypothetical protein
MGNQSCLFGKLILIIIQSYLLLFWYVGLSRTLSLFKEETNARYARNVWGLHFLDWARKKCAKLACQAIASSLREICTHEAPVAEGYIPYPENIFTSPLIDLFPINFLSHRRNIYNPECLTSQYSLYNVWTMIKLTFKSTFSEAHPSPHTP